MSRPATPQHDQYTGDRVGRPATAAAATGPVQPRMSRSRSSNLPRRAVDENVADRRAATDIVRSPSWEPQRSGCFGHHQLMHVGGRRVVLDGNGDHSRGRVGQFQRLSAIKRKTFVGFGAGQQLGGDVAGRLDPRLSGPWIAA